MSFIDDLSKTLANVGQTAVEKGKEVAEVAKVKALILNEQRKQSEVFLKAGKLYVELHKDDAEEPFQGFIADYKAACAKIEELKASLEKNGVVVDAEDVEIVPEEPCACEEAPAETPEEPKAE